MVSLQGSRGVRGQPGPRGIAGLPGPQVRTSSSPCFWLALAVANKTVIDAAGCTRTSRGPGCVRTPWRRRTQGLCSGLTFLCVNGGRSRSSLCSGPTWRSWRSGRPGTSGTARTAGRYLKNPSYQCGANVANANGGAFQGQDGRDGYGPPGSAGVKVSPQT